MNNTNTCTSLAEPQVLKGAVELTLEQTEQAQTTLVTVPTKVNKDDSSIENNIVVDKIGHLTRTLHDSLHELGYDTRLRNFTAEVPETQDRLSYVATKSEEAAERVLAATEIAMPIQDKLSTDAVSLSEQWKQALEAGQSLPNDTDKFKDLLIQTIGYLDAVPDQSKQINTQLMDIMMAQDFQDLTGQVMKKVTKMVQNIEKELLLLLVEYVPKQKKEEVNSGLTNGPVIKPDNAADVVTDQNQVDDLLASMGF